jgi:LemA protein
MSTAGIIIIVVIAVIVIWFVGAYNHFVRLDNDCQEAYSTMDVYLKKRFDLVPNLIETVKGYTKYESETLTKVVDARNAVASSSGAEEKIANENVLTGTLRSLFALAESYPDLKANQNFLDLQDQLRAIENDIANARKYYNAVVKKFNISLQQFPTNIIGKMFHYEKKPLFEVADEQERQNVKVQF